MSLLCVEADVCNVDVLSAAALHDTIEDTETTRDELKAEFGKQIAEIVAAAASLVTIADKIANLRHLAANPPADWSVERRRDYFVWAKAVVDQLPTTHLRLRELFDEIYAQKP